MENNNIKIDTYESQMNIINNDIKNIRDKINNKMDSYFIDEEKIIYDVMMKYYTGDKNNL